MTTNEPQSDGKFRTVIVVLLLIILFLVGVVVCGTAKFVDDPWLSSLVVVFGMSLSASVLFALIHWFILALCEGSRFARLYKLIENVCAANLDGTLDRLDDLESNNSDLMSELLKSVGTLCIQLSELKNQLRCRVVDYMDYCVMFDELSKGDELWWNDTYAPNWQLWIENLKDAVLRGARIKMLVQNPRSKNAEHRASELGFKSYKRDLKQFFATIESCSASLTDAEGSLEILQYNDLPGSPLYVVCKLGEVSYGYSSNFLGKPTGLGFPHIRWDQGEVFLDYLYAYVKEKWGRNRIQGASKQEKDSSDLARKTE